MIPIVRVVALREEGISELVDKIDEHAAYLRDSGQREVRRVQSAKHLIMDAMRAELSRRYLGEGDVRLDELAQRVAQGQLDPHTAGEMIIDGAERSG
jgi:LAO/AO transport system kinase